MHLIRLMLQFYCHCSRDSAKGPPCDYSGHVETAVFQFLPKSDRWNNYFTSLVFQLAKLFNNSYTGRYNNN